MTEAAVVEEGVTLGTVRHSPAHRPARVGRDVVEDVLLEVKSLHGRVNRTAIVQRLEESLTALRELRLSSIDAPEHLKLLEGCRKCLDLSIDAVEGHSLSPTATKMCERLRGVERMLEHAREAVIDAVVAQQSQVIDEALHGRAQERVPDLQPFALSHGLPRLHALEREPLRTSVDVTPDDYLFEEHDEDPDSEESAPTELGEEEQYQADLEPHPDEQEEEEEPPPSVDPAKRLAVLVAPRAADVEATMVSGIDGELAVLKRMARDCLEEIGSCANLRRLKDRERFLWDVQRGFEQRMCDGLDMLVATAQPFFMASGGGARYPGLDILAETVRYGRDGATVDPSRAYARAFVLGSIAGADTVRAAILALKQSHPLTYTDQMHAMSMAPNPAISDALRQLTTDDDPRLVCFALDGLYGRRAADVATIVPLLEHNDDGVRIRAARALGVATERETAAKLLADFLASEIDDDASAAAVEALVFQGVGIELVRERLAEEVEEAGTLRADIRARFMQLLGVAGQAHDYKLLMALYSGQAGEALAAGLHGHVALVPMLLDPLSPKPTVFAGAAQRREAAAALQRITGAPMHTPREPTDNYDVLTDFPMWSVWWQDNQDQFDPELRYRFGKPWSGLSPVEELEADNVPMALRRMLALEIGILLQERPTLGHEFAARQAAQLAAQRSTIEAAIGEHLTRFLGGHWPGAE